MGGPLVLRQSCEIRARLSSAMSEMYRAEVPQYGKLLEIVSDVNRAELRDNQDLRHEIVRSDELNRLGVERHGAIRLGTAAELTMIRRIFAVMGMYPVGYYDLSMAGIPVHSTAFRPIGDAELKRNPFRIFTSLLRLELIESQELREEVHAVLENRHIFTPKAIDLTQRFEQKGRFTDTEVEAFVTEVLETFRWHGEATVDAATYGRLSNAHSLIADIVCFKGPHINHLTPRTLNIDAAQAAMVRHGLPAKALIEGPPPRKCPILLRQTSFKALEERVLFMGRNLLGLDHCLLETRFGVAGGVHGSHTARFGEIEQRGLALTPKGRVLYDRLLASVREANDKSSPERYTECLTEAFSEFPDNYPELRREGLGYFRYAAVHGAHFPDGSLESLLDEGSVSAEPITYEDFLPVSAAGIFSSNLVTENNRTFTSNDARASFQVALGACVLNEFELYAAIERASLKEARCVLHLPAE
jgi:uncharacterized glyoxalase superfamily metalloenzyme YdcJ